MSFYTETTWCNAPNSRERCWSWSHTYRRAKSCFPQQSRLDRAPDILFVDMSWRILGTKVSLVTISIASITSIAEKVSQTGKVNHICVAKKMSWAAPKDWATGGSCLLLDVNICMNMSTIYGEGDKVFFRLQEEIIKSSVDQSIFAWVKHGRCMFSGSMGTVHIWLRYSCYSHQTGIATEPERPFKCLK